MFKGKEIVEIGRFVDEDVKQKENQKQYLKKHKKNSILLVLPYLGCLESTPNHILGIGE